MLPFAGAGANLVMADGANLGLALAKAKTPSELLEHVQCKSAQKKSGGVDAEHGSAFDR
jgi:2-polyprenyl-6-methoxyphenol hydroxylase-like FAD-dependent oxidoreductase